MHNHSSILSVSGEWFTHVKRRFPPRPRGGRRRRDSPCGRRPVDHTVVQIASMLKVLRTKVYGHLNKRVDIAPITQDVDDRPAPLPTSRRRPTCGHEPTTRSEAVHQRAALAVMWLHRRHRLRHLRRLPHPHRVTRQAGRERRADRAGATMARRHRMDHHSGSSLPEHAGDIVNWARRPPQRLEK